MYLLVLGDSLSAGVGASLPSSLGYAALLHRNHHPTWPIFAGRDIASYAPTLKFKNLARSGATSLQTLSLLKTSIGELKGSEGDGRAVAVMTTGGNDFKNALWQEALANPESLYETLTGTPLDSTMATLTRIVTLLNHPHLFAQGVDVYLCNLYDPTDGTERASLPWGDVELPGLSRAMTAWNTRYKLFCQANGVELIDANCAFAGHGLTAKGADCWLRDWLHPNDTGHHVLRELFMQAIERRQQIG